MNMTKTSLLFMTIPLIPIVTILIKVQSSKVAEKQLSDDYELVQDCGEEKDCEGLSEALERLVNSNKNLQSYELNNVDLEGANLKGADLTLTDLKNANLEGVKLQRAKLKGVRLQEANLQSANLQKADLGGTELQGANLQNANLQKAELRRTKLEGANLQGANLQKAELIFVDFKNASFKGANLKDAMILSSQNLSAAQIKSACHWEKAIYRFDLQDKGIQSKSKVDKEANEEFIRSLEKDPTSNPKELADCNKW